MSPSVVNSDLVCQEHDERRRVALFVDDPIVPQPDQGLSQSESLSRFEEPVLVIVVAPESGGKFGFGLGRQWHPSNDGFGGLPLNAEGAAQSQRRRKHDRTVALSKTAVRGEVKPQTAGGRMSVSARRPTLTGKYFHKPGSSHGAGFVPTPDLRRFLSAGHDAP